MDGKVPTTDRPARWLNLPRSMSGAELKVLGWAIILADDEAVVVRRDLAELLDARDRIHLTVVIRALEGRGCVRRLPKPRPLGSHIRVSWSRIYEKAWKQCLNCPRPVKNVRGARYCATCQASVARHDRSWKATAFEIWHDALTRKQGEAALVYRICMATGQPAYSRRGAGADVGKEGVVPNLLAEGLLVDKLWSDRMRAHNSNEGDDLP